MTAETATLNSSMASSNFSNKKASLSYTTCDRGLMFFQRLLFCTLIMIGHDMGPNLQANSGMILVRALARIIRNFFFIIKAVRKWLSIQFNYGIIPPSAIRTGYGNDTGNKRSTPKGQARNSHLDERSANGSLKQSPIEHCYTEPSRTYGIVAALQDRERIDLCNPHVYDSSDFLGHSSLNLKSMLHSFYEGLVGIIDDPDPENQQPSQQESGALLMSIEETNSQAPKNKQDLQPGESQVDLSENLRRAQMVSESVIEYSEIVARKLAAGIGFERRLEPLPVPNFDETSAVSVQNVENEDK